VRPALKRVIIVAFHFPPFAGSSGVQRALRFVQHLPEFGWEAAVVSAHPRGYEQTSNDLLAAIPRQTHVERAFTLNAARDLSLRGRYLHLTAIPDRWSTWRFAAIRAGLRLIEKYQPQVIWSTYPIATAHVIGSALQRRSGLPWIAEFRDPMVQVSSPDDPWVRASFERIEREALLRARFSVFTTSGAARSSAVRHPAAAERIRVIENGFDEESFAGIENDQVCKEPLIPGALTLLHSGIVYPRERDPRHLFQALRHMADAGLITPNRVRLRFRATGHDELVLGLISRYQVSAFVEVMPAISYREALHEMLRADGLLVMQGADCNAQIPAKLYEYIRASRPILGLTCTNGSTARTLRDAGLDMIAPLDSVDAIIRILGQFLDAVAKGHAALPDRSYIEKSSRKGRTRALADLLDQAVLG
jgi:hypothetical protein